MQPFISSQQYNFIKSQAQILVNAHATANDQDVLKAVRSLAMEKVLQQFDAVDKEHSELLQPLVEIKSKEDAELFSAQIKPYVIPFPSITEQTVKKLFPKAKKLKNPSLEDVDMSELSYVGWYDKGSGRKYIITHYNDKLVGIHGTFTPSNQKGICALCNRHQEVGMFMSETKGSHKDTFTKRGNYICQDSQACNQNLTTLDKLHDFIARLQ